MGPPPLLWPRAPWYTRPCLRSNLFLIGLSRSVRVGADGRERQSPFYIIPSARGWCGEGRLSKPASPLTLLRTTTCTRPGWRCLPGASLRQNPILARPTRPARRCSGHASTSLPSSRSLPCSNIPQGASRQWAPPFTPHLNSLTTLPLSTSPVDPSGALSTRSRAGMRNPSSPRPPMELMPPTEKGLPQFKAWI